MISVYLSSNETQMMQANVNARKVSLQSCDIIPESFLSAFDNLDHIDVERLMSLFAEAKDTVPVKHDTVAVVLPDYLFEMIDCFSYSAEAEIKEHIAQTLHRSLAEVYISMPIFSQPQPLEKDVTVCVIDCRIVDALVEAAKKENVYLESIEPASVSYLRCSETFLKEELLWFQYLEHATLLAFSSICGLFKMDVPQLSEKQLQTLPEEEAEKLIMATLAELDQTALQTFTFFNKEVPLVIFASGHNRFSGMRSRQTEPRFFPAYIQNDVVEEEMQQAVMPTVGAFLQRLDFSDEAFGMTDTSLTFLSGNLLPEAVKRNTAMFLRINKLQHVVKIAACFLFVVAVIEAAGVLFLSDTVIPDNLKEDYQAAQSSMPAINKELEIIQLYEKEDQQVLVGYQGIVSSRPNGLGFTSVEIGAKARNEWIKVRVAAKDPLVFQDYVTALAKDPLFSNVTIKAINSDGSGYKTADISIGRR